VSDDDYQYFYFDTTDDVAQGGLGVSAMSLNVFPLSSELLEDILPWTQI